MNLVFQLFQAGYDISLAPGGKLTYGFYGRIKPTAKAAAALLEELKARKNDVMKYLRAVEDCISCKGCPACALRGETLYCFGYAYFDAKGGISKPCREVFQSCKQLTARN